MTRMTLNPQQAEFLEKYVLKHQWTASMKIADASKFVRRKGKIYELMSRLPSLHLDDAKKQMALADQLANQGDFTGAYKAMESTKFALRDQIANYDPQPDFDFLRAELKEVSKPLRQMLSTYEQFIKRPKDNSLSDAEWKNKIDTSLEKTLTFLKKPQETLAAFATVERQLKEVDQACRPDQLDQGKDIHKNIQELKSQLQVLMQAPGKYMTPDQCRVKVYGANVQQAKAESDFNSLQDKINRALDSIPSWLRQDVTKELGALGSYTRAKDFAGALAALPAIQAKTVQLVKSFSADTELIAIAKELGSVKQNIEKCLAKIQRSVRLTNPVD